MTLTARRGLRIPAYLLGVGLAFSTWLTPAESLAQAVTPPEGTITTQGHGEVQVRPDSVSVTVSVEARNQTLAQARTENNRKMQAIIAALKGLNVPSLKLETLGVQVHPVHEERQRDRPPQIVGYRVSNRLNVTVTNAAPDTLGELGSRLVDTALNAGANQVSGLNFFLHDMTAVRAQALAMAVQDARRNADAMAQAANVTLSDVHSIEGYPQFGGHPPRPMPMAMRAEAASADIPYTPVEVGESTITSNVTMRFKF